MKRSVRLSSTIALASAAMVIPTTAAHATGYAAYYCGITKGSGHWCGATSFGLGVHSWDENEATGIYSTTQVCQRLVIYATQEVVAGQTCQYSQTDHYYGNVTAVIYDAHVEQNSGADQVVGGWGAA